MKLDYDTLKQAAREAKAEMVAAGRWKKTGIRRKPRDPGDLEAMRLRALERMEKYPWRVREDGVIELPWFIERFKQLDEELGRELQRSSGVSAGSCGKE